MIDLALPPALLRALRDVHDDAEGWLETLPETLAGLESRWHIRVTGLVPQLSYNLVAYAQRLDGTPCILKLSPPNDEIVCEAEALKYYAGDGICQLLERADDVSALLLERVTPGVSLQELWTPGEDKTHTQITAELMRRLWRPVVEPNLFRSLTSWTGALWEDYESIPTDLQRQAQGLLQGLNPEQDPVLLHADLHHGNILTATKEPFLAIDPKGIVGARGYDVGTYLHNPMQATAAELIALLPSRLKIFSGMLGLGRQELARWGFVHMVLSACWDAEMHGDWDVRALKVARGLERFL